MAAARRRAPVLAAAVAVLAVLVLLLVGGTQNAKTTRPTIQYSALNKHAAFRLTIVSNPIIGGQLYTTSGTWGNSPTSFTYQWQLCNSGTQTCSNATGSPSTSQLYTIVNGDQTGCPAATSCAFQAVVTEVGGTGNNHSQTSVQTGILGGGVGGGGNGTLLFDGTFDAGSPPGANWPGHANGTCYTVLSATQVRFDITAIAACNPGNDGHYRSDLCSSFNCERNVAGDWYVAGQPSCTTIPFNFPSLPAGVPSSTHLQYAEIKDWEAGLAGWGMYLNAFWNGDTPSSPNQYAIQFGSGLPVQWHSSVNVTTGWHTTSICTNNANNSSGQVYGIWLDGVRQTMNAGPCNGLQSCGGFPIINDGSNSWPLDVNDYTAGGSAVPNSVILGDPLIATIGTNNLPPMPPGGWNSP